MRGEGPNILWPGIYKEDTAIQVTTSKQLAKAVKGKQGNLDIKWARHYQKCSSKSREIILERVFVVLAPKKLRDQFELAGEWPE